jgi:hypothetical protein
MVRLFALALFSLTLFAAAAGAQTARPKAYAPEDLRQLSENDQIRVIAREYGDQTGGREIPDDQMEFYLDQIDSGWTFSRIKDDITTSLGNNGRPGNGNTWNNGNNNGNNNGWNNGNNGNHNGWNNGNNPNATGPVIKCESRNERATECQTNFTGRAVLSRNLSRTECVEGQNWGQRPGMLWVNRGCRGEFAQLRGRNASNWQDSEYGRYSVTCASTNERYATCAWNSRYGTPVLAQRTSRTECVEGRSWGYRNGSLWVDRGCRARFTPDYEWRN